MSAEAQTLSASVSLLESYRWWKDSDQDFAEFLAKLKEPRSEQMKVGEAFHKMLAAMEPGSFRERTVDGYVFNFDECEGELQFGGIFEHPCSKRYGDLLVRGRVDELLGNTVTDFKLCFGSFDSEKYMESFQWRYYLDILNAAVFEYAVFMIYPQDDFYAVRQLHKLRLYSYPELHRDCCKLAAEFARAAIIHPELQTYRNVETGDIC